MTTITINPLQNSLKSAIRNQITSSTDKVTPKEFCDYWVPKKSKLLPTDWGYASACVRELALALRCTENTIRKWGVDFEGYPKVVGHRLSDKHKLYQIAEIVSRDYD